MQRELRNPWWDNDCSEAIKSKKTALKQYLNAPSLDNYVNFRKVRAHTRKILREKKRTNFQSFCENLNPLTSIDRVWKCIRRFKSSFSPILPVPTLGAAIPEQLLASLDHPFWPSLQDDAPRNTEKSDPICFHELWSVISKKKDSTSGRDLVTFGMIKNQHPPAGFALSD